MFMDAEKMNLFFRRKIKYLEKVKFGLYIVKLVNLSAVNSKVINEFSFCCLLFFIFFEGFDKNYQSGSKCFKGNIYFTCITHLSIMTSLIH